MNRLVLGTRGSALALAQSELTGIALIGSHPGLVWTRQVFTTRGDMKLDLGLLRSGEAGGKGLFTKELEEALLCGSIDVAVHSLKDLPAQNPEGLHIGAVLERAPMADILVSRNPCTLGTLPPASRIGTSSIRRARQIQWLRPDLSIEEWRGNVPTRLRKLRERPEVAAIILAEAGLLRLGYAFAGDRLGTAEGDFYAVSLSEQLLPAIGQGAIALQCRVEDVRVNRLLSAVNHEPTWICIRAEREFQRLLGGDCTLPVGVRSVLDGDRLMMTAVLFGVEGRPPQRADASGNASEPEKLAVELFHALR